MAQLIAGDIRFFYGDTLILQNISLTIAPGSKIGLVGPNGCGKSTLLHILAGDLNPSSGSISLTRDATLALLEQDMEWEPTKSLMESVMSCSEELNAIEKRMKELEFILSDSSDADIISKYGELQTRYEVLGGYSLRSRAERYLSGVGLERSLWNKPVRQLSGGQQRRAGLVQVLLLDADILLLDEPTNYLDVWARTFLENELLRRDQGFMVVSHDRYFLNTVTNYIAELDQTRLFMYSGNYSAFLTQRNERRLRSLKEHERVSEEKERLRTFVAKNIAGQKHKQALSRRKRLEKLESAEMSHIPSSRRRMKLTIEHSRREGRIVLSISDLAVGYGHQTLVSEFDMQLERGEKLAIIGPNGSGKTSLLLTMLQRIPPKHGTVEWGHNVDVAYLAQETEPEIHGDDPYSFIESLKPEWKQGEIRSYLAGFQFRGDHVFQPVYTLSGGERSRLALAGILLSPANVLVLDEPTNHLDIDSSESLERSLLKFPGTMILVSHDRRLIDRVAQRALVLRNLSAQFVRPPFKTIWDFHDDSDRREKRQAKDANRPGRRETKRRFRSLQVVERDIDRKERELENLRVKQLDPEISDQWEYLLKIHREEQQIQSRINELIEEWEAASEHEENS